MKPGEMLVRTRMSEITERLTVLEALAASGKIGQRYWRYRLRWLRHDFTRTEEIARRYGFKV
jgi:hypothetical protein